MALVTSKSEIGSNAVVAEDCQESTGLAFDSFLTGVVFALILTVGQRAIGFVRGVLFCRLMTDQELGQWSMVWSFLMLLAPLAMLGLPGCFGRYTEYFRQRGQLRSFIYRIALVSLTLSAFASGAIILFPQAAAQLIFRDPSQVTLVRCLGGALMAVAISNFAISLTESLRQVRAVTVMRFITGLSFALIGTFLLTIWSDGSSAVTVGYAICSLLGLVPAIWLLRRMGRTNEQPVTPLSHSEMWRRIAPFAIWLWISNLFHNLFEVTDRYMLIHWSDTTADVAQGLVGQYHSGRVVPLLLVSVATMLAGVMLPFMSAAWEAGKKNEACNQLNWTFKLMGLAFTIGGILVLLGSPILFEWILQGRYNAGLAILPMTLVYCIWFSLFTIAQDYLWVAEKGKLATAAVGMGLAANILLNILLIPSMGLSGAVLATTCGNLLTIILMLTLNHFCGCRTDVGIWLVAIIPLVLLLSPWIASIGVAVAGLLGCFTPWIFSDDEKTEILSICNSCQSKIRRAIGGSNYP
jgi:PST family polysaccharide transporter